MIKVSNNNPVEDELNAIRIKLNEQTKNMTSEEQVDFFNTGAKEILARHGVKATFADAPLKLQRAQP
jgi:hypothetical protein